MCAFGSLKLGAFTFVPGGRQRVVELFRAFPEIMETELGKVNPSILEPESFKFCDSWSWGIEIMFCSPLLYK